MQVRLAERVATALTALHNIHVIHAAICPAALRVSPDAAASSVCPAGPPESTPAAHPATASHSYPASHPAPSSNGIASSLKSMSFKSRHTVAEVPPQDLRVMLADFSAACALAPPDYSVPSSHMREPLVAVAARYSPPERRSEDETLTKRSDIYSWAATMYHLMTCQHPCVTESACCKGISSSVITGGDRMDSTEKASGIPQEVCCGCIVLVATRPCTGIPV